jgi:hypothetical protein
MKEAMAKEIQRLKNELYKKKEEIRDLKKLVNKEIDREFQSDLGELSDRELETYAGEFYSSAERNMDLRLDKESITSHRKIFGKLIVQIKRALLRITGVYSYIDPFLDKQIQFNRQSFALHQASILRLRRVKDKMKQIEEKISDCEENLVIIMNKMEDLPLRREQHESKAANHDPTVKE